MRKILTKVMVLALVACCMVYPVNIKAADETVSETVNETEYIEISSAQDL